VAQIYRRLLGNGSAIGQTVNICSGRATSLREVIALCRELTGHDLEIVTNPAFVRANEVQVLAGSTARLDALIGPVPRTPLIDTLRWMLSESRDAS
jgi:nucleoside-diphosphate-sugar epimerase